MKLRRRHKLILSALGIYWPVIFWLTHIPMPELARQSGMSDKMMHVLAYFVLTFLVWFAVNPYEKVRWNKPKVWILLAVIAGYAVLDEYLQIHIGRSADVLDFVSDLFGLVIGLGVLSIFSFWPALLAYSAGFIFLVSVLSNLPGLYPEYHLSGFFHYTAYAAFAVIWTQMIERYRRFQFSQSPGLWLSLSVPFLLLFIVKGTALLFGRAVGWIDAAAALIGIVSAVLIHYGILRFRRKLRCR